MNGDDDKEPAARKSNSEKKRSRLQLNGETLVVDWGLAKAQRHQEVESGIEISPAGELNSKSQQDINSK